MEALLDLVLLLLSLRAAWRLLSGINAGLRPRAPRASSSPAASVQMARDPVCGTFVVPDRAVSLTVGHHRFYFCSAACRDRYRAQTA